MRQKYERRMDIMIKNITEWKQVVKGFKGMITSIENGKMYARYATEEEIRKAKENDQNAPYELIDGLK
jgi:hypothetical protein